MKNSSNKGLHDRLRILEDKIKILKHQREARNINENEDKKIICPECGSVIIFLSYDNYWSFLYGKVSYCCFKCRHNWTD